MLFKSIQPTNILEIPEFPAEIKGISKRESGDYIHYRFYVSVDLDQAVEQNALDMKVDIYKNKPTPIPVPKKIRTADLWSNSTKKLERSVIKSRAIMLDKRITFRTVDLTRYLSNDLANRLSTNRLSLTRQQQNSISARAISITPPDPFTRNASAAFKPTPTGVRRPSGAKVKKGSNTPLSSTVVQGIKINPPSSKSFSKTVLRAKKDPAMFSTKTSKSVKNSSPPQIQMKVADMVFTPPRALSVIPTVKFTPRKRQISFGMTIKRSKLSTLGSFYMSIEIENSSGVKVASGGVKIPHASILNAYLTPRHAPLLEAEYIKPGAVSVRVKKSRRDVVGTRLKVFRRLAPPTEGSTGAGSPWIEVFDSDTQDNAEFAFRDLIATSRPLLYRAVSYGENSKPSEDFSSTVVLPLKEFKVKQTGSLTAITSLDTSGQNTFVTAVVKDIPYDVIAVMVRRYNKTFASEANRKASKGSGFVYVGSTASEQQVFVKDIDDDGSALFTDETAKPGNNYVYVPVGVTKNGKEIVGSSSALEIPYSPERAKVSMSVSSPAFRRGTDSLTMDLSAKFTDFGFSEIRRSLQAANQADLFSADVLEDRDKFEPLIGFLVERTNNKTGEQESFGTYNSGKFEDNEEIREQKNLKPLEPGVEYTYTVTALVSSPETLFPTLKRSEIDDRTLVPFSRRISKFQSVLAINKATLASTQRQQDRTLPSAVEPTDPLLAGRTNVQITKTIRAPILYARKEKIRIEEHRNFNRVIWLAPGVSGIDHFRIYVVSSGGKVLIDTVHCDDSSSDFYYRHDDKDYAVNFQYMIQPISLSYKERKPILSKVIRPNNEKNIRARFGSFSIVRV